MKWPKKLGFKRSSAGIEVTVFGSPLLHVHNRAFLAGQLAGINLLLKKPFERLLSRQGFFGELKS
jgi:hypothetical protein